LPSKPPAEKEKRGVPKKKVDDTSGVQDDKQNPAADSQAMDVETQDPGDEGDATLVDSQAQSHPSNTQTDTQPLEEADDEPIDWPDSPPTATVNDDD